MAEQGGVDTEWSTDWDKLFAPLGEEMDYELTEIEGVVPAGLRGSWWRNGPGLLEVGGTKIQGSVDGDGMIVRVTFDGKGRAFLKNRHIRTDGFVKEQEAGKILFRGVFGTLPADEEHLRGTMLTPKEFMASSRKPYKNVSNTNLLALPNRTMLSLWEGGGFPYLLNPDTLETIGTETFGNILKPTSVFSAHPCMEVSTQRLVNFGIVPGMETKLEMWEMDISGMEVGTSGSKAKLVQHHSFVLNDQAVIHDMAITPKWAIIVHNPVSFNMEAAMVKGISIDKVIGRESDPDATTRIYLVPRDPSLLGGVQGGTNTLFAEYHFENGFTYHHVNAYEDADDNIVLDCVVYGQKPDLDMRNTTSRIELNTICGKGRLMRYKLPTPRSAGEVPGRGSPELLPGSPDSCEMPIARDNMQGQMRRFVYSVNVACDAGHIRPWSGLLKTDVSTGELSEWRAPARCFVSEPCFIPRGSNAEDDGWVAELMFDGAKGRSVLVLLDAKNITAGPVCKLWLKHHIPLSHHIMWTPEAYGMTQSSRL